MNSLLFCSCFLACLGLAYLGNPFLPQLPPQGQCFKKCNDGLCENFNCVDYDKDGKCDVCTQEPVNGDCQCLQYFQDGSCDILCPSKGLNQPCERTDCIDEDQDGWCDVSVCNEYKDGKCVKENCVDNDGDGFCDNLCDIKYIDKDPGTDNE